MSLALLNKVAAGIQISLVVLLLVWFIKFRDNTFPVVAAAVTPDKQTRVFWTTDATVVFVLLLVFASVTALFHLGYALEWFPDYSTRVQKGNNSYRWVEYTLTATLMLEAIALSSGVASLDSQILIALCCAGAMPMGDVVEKAHLKNDTTTVAVATGVGWLLVGGAYGVIFRNFLTAASNQTESQRPPAFVYAVVIVMALAFVSFGVIQAVYLTDKYGNYEMYEKIYTIDSMVSKSLLVGLLFGGLAGRKT